MFNIKETFKKDSDSNFKDLVSNYLLYILTQS